MTIFLNFRGENKKYLKPPPIEVIQKFMISFKGCFGCLMSSLQQSLANKLDF